MLFVSIAVQVMLSLLVLNNHLVSSLTLTDSSDSKLALFPLQIVADIKITAHLISEDNAYPPRYRSMKIYYDYINKRARADIEAGYEAAKIYIRRYDLDAEYMVRLPPINDCKRAYLGEIMPFPELPDQLVYQNEETVDGIRCNYFLYEELDSRVHVYIAIDTGAPIKLLQESTSNQESTPLLTYDFSNVIIGQPDESDYLVDALGFNRDTCDRSVSGFPYLHVFHHFVKF